MSMVRREVGASAARLPAVRFSVLMSVYHGERPEYLDAALTSLQSSRVALPEVVLVEDGPLPDALHVVIGRHAGVLNLRRVVLQENAGLGPALTAGLQQCSHEWVARFDTDDLIVADRFERQLEQIRQFPDIDVFGGWIREFDNDLSEDSMRLRRVPRDHADIVDYAKGRNPFNHMTVMFRRELALSLGGYRNEYLYEDYALWVRMIQAGARTANLPVVLVNARAGAGMYGRRGGWRYVTGEIRAQWGFYRTGFIGLPRLAVNLLSRVPVRLMPGAVRRFIYERVLRVHGK